MATQTLNLPSSAQIPDTLAKEPALMSANSGNWRTTDPDLADCREKLHRAAFRVSHSLSSHPLFQLDELIGVAKQAARRRGDLYFDAGNVALGDKWGQIPIPELPITEIIRRIETAGAWIVMKHVETDPRYRAILDEYAEFVREIAGPKAAKYLINPEMLVFITSPHRVTPFHFDAEVNFLVQLHGSKDLWVCDPADQTVSTPEEIERYYAVAITSPTYRSHAELAATKFTLEPGDAVHIPTHAAHWVKNHENMSVSLSLNFEFPKWMKADVYRANHRLRKLGISPWPPGRSAILDRTKVAMFRASRSINGGFKKLLGRSPKPQA